QRGNGADEEAQLGGPLVLGDFDPLDLEVAAVDRAAGRQIARGKDDVADAEDPRDDVDLRAVRERGDVAGAAGLDLHDVDAFGRGLGLELDHADRDFV